MTRDRKTTRSDHDDAGQEAIERTRHEATMPLAEEELSTQTHDVTTGHVTVRKRVETVPYETTIDVGRDEIDVERVPMNQDVEEDPGPRQEGDTLIVPVVVEVLVIEKRLRVVEEVRVTKRRVSETQTIREDLRREVVDVVEEDAPPDT